MFWRHYIYSYWCKTVIYFYLLINYFVRPSSNHLIILSYAWIFQGIYLWSHWSARCFHCPAHQKLLLFFIKWVTFGFLSPAANLCWYFDLGLRGPPCVMNLWGYWAIWSLLRPPNICTRGQDIWFIDSPYCCLSNRSVLGPTEMSWCYRAAWSFLSPASLSLN